MFKVFIINILCIPLFLVSCESKKEINSQKSLKMEHIYDENHSIDETIKVKETAIDELKKLLSIQKFEADNDENSSNFGYVGLLPEENRPLANRTLNKLIQRLILLFEDNENITKRMVLNEFEKSLIEFENIAEDTEDRERLCYYIEEIMDIIGLESSYNLLNNWMW